MFSSSSKAIKAGATKKAHASAQTRVSERVELIDKLCETLGTHYRGLKQYRSL